MPNLSQVTWKYPHSSLAKCTYRSIVISHSFNAPALHNWISQMALLMLLMSPWWFSCLGFLFFLFFVATLAQPTNSVSFICDICAIVPRQMCVTIPSKAIAVTMCIQSEHGWHGERRSPPVELNGKTSGSSMQDTMCTLMGVYDEWKGIVLHKFCTV